MAIATLGDARGMQLASAACTALARRPSASPSVVFHDTPFGREADFMGR